ncbi:MAG: transglutaminase domain-containing protein [Gammaproteobacteria bacterium]|nr:transglutaminase domain-containing protein [Gammaproteobacteria bacterium]
MAELTESRMRYFPTSMRAAIIASSFWVLSLSLTVLSGSVAAFVGCVLTCYLMDGRLRRPPLQQLRSFAIILAALVVCGMGLLLASLLTSTALPGALTSPMLAFNAGEFLQWFALSASITAILRTLAHRTSYGAVIEILFVATAFVITLAAHRNGMIHRPFFIGDFALVRGIDPSAILMAFGCAAVLSLAALLMVENTERRLPYHFAVLGMLCFSLLIYIRMFGLPTPQLTDDLGLTGQEQLGNSSQRDNPFRDGENDASDKEAPVAVVVFRDDYTPLNGAYYFRESAYSEFRGSMLDFTTRADMDQDLIKNFTNTRSESAQLPTALDQHTPVRMTIGMLVAHRSPFGLESPVAYENVANPNNLRFKRTYDAYSMAPEYDFEYMLGRETGRADWSDEVLQKYLEVPDDPRYKELAESLLTDLKPEYADDPFAKAWSIKTYLDENGIYSLKNEHAYADDPAASFLFGDLTGYCMHFSFAATYMFRSVGIPSRVGIGYSVPASNRAGGSSLLVQAIHGHAWPEIYFKDVGWVIVDPAPQQTLVDMSTDPQNELQQLLGDMLRDDASFEDFLDSQQTPFIDLQMLLNTLYAVALLILLAGYSVKFYRLWIPAHTVADKQYRVGYRAVLDKLSAVGMRRRYGESREQFARRASTLTPSIELMTDAHLRCALGDAAVQNNPSQWAAMRLHIDQELRASTATSRRVIALINPFSWLMTK